MSGRGDRGGGGGGGYQGDRGRGRGRGNNDGPRGGYGGGDRGRGGYEGGGGGRGGYTPRGDGGRGGYAPRGDGGARGGYAPRGDAGGRGGRGGYPPRGDGGYRGGGGGGPRVNPIYKPGDVPPYDAKITKLENDAIQQKPAPPGPVVYKVGKDGKQEPIVALPRRPGYGTVGNPITLRTNYFELVNNSKEKLYRYDISVLNVSGGGEDQDLSKTRRRRYIELMMADPIFKGKVAATDYSKMLVMKQRLVPEANTPDKDDPELLLDDTKDFRILFKEKLSDAVTAPTAGQSTQGQAAVARKTRHITVRFLYAISVGELWQYLAKVQPDARYERKDDVRQLLNVILHRPSNAQDNIVNVGQNEMFVFEDKFRPHTRQDQRVESIELGEGLRAMRGYFSSVRLATGRVLVNVKQVARAFYNHGPASDLLDQFWRGERRPLQLRKDQSSLKGLRVVLEHTYAEGGKKGDKKRVRRVRVVNGLSPPVSAKAAVKGQPAIPYQPMGQNSNQKMFMWDGTAYGSTNRMHSVTEYFKFHYGIVLKRPELPVLNVGNTANPTYVPPELAYVLGGQPARKMLTPDQTTRMLNFGARAPDENARSIEEQGLPALSLNGAQDSVKQMGVTMSQQMLTVPARQLPPPKLLWAGTARSDPYQGSWNLQGVKFMTPNRAEINLAVMEFYVDRPQRDLSRVLSETVSELKKYNVAVKQSMTPSKQIPRIDIANYAAIQAAIREMFEAAVKRQAFWLLILLPDKNAWMYARIKYYADVVYGIHTVCVTGGNVAKILKPDPGFIGNLGLKFIAKSGGQAWMTDPNSIRPIDKDTMIVGIDVTHPGPGSAKTAPSIAAVVASYNDKLTAYLGAVRTQESRKEMVTALTELIIERLEVFQAKNERRLPKKVLVYRDGVSEGQFNDVLHHEFGCMQEAFAKKYGDKKNYPKTSIIVVGKRHHTRFFPTVDSPKEKDKSGNCMPGTVVDRHITGMTGEGVEVWDFFLQPHKALKGTAKPVHCIVIKDEIGLGVQVEAMTHALCYGFHRATKAISLPPPAYCADLLCERGRMYLYNMMNDVIDDSASEASGGTAATGAWTGNVHARLKDTMFYI